MYTPLSFNDRINAIYETNPEYGERIMVFLDKNPEFSSIARLFPLSDKMTCFTKESDPTTCFEFLLYYIAEAGVNAKYGHAQWLLIKDHIRAHDTKPFDGLFTLKLQPKKVQVYKDIETYLSANFIGNPYKLTLNDVEKMQKEIKGIGDGCLTFLYTIYDTSRVYLPDYSEIGFKKGFQKFYNLPKMPTKKQVMDKSKNWSDIHLVNELLHQVYNYM